MIVNEGGRWEPKALPRDAWSDMSLAQLKLQRDLSLWDDRVSRRSPVFVMPRRVLHNLDCASQEASEAWDMLEGGWKHHKRNPERPDPGEVVLELVDVMAYVINAFLFMGGDTDAALVAKSISFSQEVSIIPLAAGLEYGFDVPKLGRLTDNVFKLYDHGQGAHGELWVKQCAAWVNFLRSQVFRVSDTIRHGIATVGEDPREFPPAPGFVWWEIVPAICGAASAVPGIGPEEFYSAFMHKALINQRRREEGY